MLAARLFYDRLCFSPSLACPVSQDVGAGRNLGNKRYGTLGVDKPGGAGEVYTVAGEQRVILLQLEGRF